MDYALFGCVIVWRCGCAFSTVSKRRAFGWSCASHVIFISIRWNCLSFVCWICICFELVFGDSNASRWVVSVGSVSVCVPVAVDYVMESWGGQFRYSYLRFMFNKIISVWMNSNRFSPACLWPMRRRRHPCATCGRFAISVKILLLRRDYPFAKTNILQSNQVFVDTRRRDIWAIRKSSLLSGMISSLSNEWIEEKLFWFSIEVVPPPSTINQTLQFHSIHQHLLLKLYHIHDLE